MRIQAVALASLSLALTGCTLKNTATPSPERPVTGAAIQGVVHGGQQPVANAHVYLFAAGTSGYGGNGIAASSSNASVPVFTAAETGLSDSVGPYILTTAGGNFTFPTYTCTPGTQVYLYVLGGNPGNGVNSALGMMAALGNCPTAGNLNTTVPYISVNEITTIAAAYALAGFASDATHISSSGTTLAQTGIANAFLNASNPASLSTGAALATTPTANGGNGTVPHDEIVTLANILAYCVNSNDANSTISSNCSTLFSYTLSGGTTGTPPTDTASAAVNIAHNPGANVSNLFKLAAAKSPYATTSVYYQPYDFSLAMQFVVGSTETCCTYGSPFVAIDGTGNIWVSHPSTYGAVFELSSTGANLSGTGGYTAGLLNLPGGIAIDPAGDIWVANENGGNIIKMSPSGVNLSGTTGFSIAGAYSGINENIAIDGGGNAWYTGIYVGIELSNSGTLISETTPQALLDCNIGVAVDGHGNGWCTGSNGIVKWPSSGPSNTTATVYKLSGLGLPLIAFDASGNLWAPYGQGVLKMTNSGVVLSGTNGFSSPNSSTAIAVDGASNIWHGFAVLSNSGTQISPASGYGGTNLAGYTVAIDGAGNAWSATGTGSTPITVTEMVGVAAPVVTPSPSA